MFLAIMLILTFFSNTIMNFSLAEVNGKYTEYGNIRTGVRGSGVVQANTVFEQAVKGSYRISEIFVREGERIVEGQLIMKLEPSDAVDNSAEIEALEEQLKGLREAYERALLSRDGDSDYTLVEMDIDNAREELDKLKEKRDYYTDEKLVEIEKEYESAEKAVEQSLETIEALEEQIAEISDESDDEEIVAARQNLERVKSVLEYAAQNLEEAKENLSDTSYTDISSLTAQRDSLSRSLGRLEQQKAALKAEHAEILALESNMNSAKTSYDTALADYESAWGQFDDDTEPTDDAQKQSWNNVKSLKSAYVSAKSAYDSNADDIKSVKAEISALDMQMTDENYSLSEIVKKISSAKSENKSYERYEKAVELAETEYKNAEKAHETAAQALEEAVEKIAKDLTQRLKGERATLKTLEKKLNEATEIKTEADSVDKLDDEIKSAERALFEMEYNLEKQKDSDDKANKLEEYDFRKQKEEIDELQAKIYKLRSKDVGSETEFISKYTGTVSSFNCRVGDTLPDGTSVISIESEESGYTLSFSVSNADSKKLKIGDTATVSGGYWGGKIDAVLSTLKTEQGGKSKLATFDLSGDVVSGQTLTLIAGEKSTSFSSVVPKSAVREDSDGKYIYITKTKSTPLGNRYAVERMPVEIVASDDINAAITSSENMYIYEFAITSSTKPIADGDYVRLAD